MPSPPNRTSLALARLRAGAGLPCGATAPLDRTTTKSLGLGVGQVKLVGAGIRAVRRGVELDRHDRALTVRNLRSRLVRNEYLLLQGYYLLSNMSKSASVAFCTEPT